MMAASNPFNTVTADLQMKIPMGKGPGEAAVTTQNDNATINTTVSSLKWLVLGLGVVVIGIVMYIYFRNVTSAKKRMVRQSELVTTAKVAATQLRAPMGELNIGDTVAADNELWRTFNNMSYAGRQQGIGWRVVDRIGNVYMSTATPAQAGVALPFMSMAQDRTKGDDSVLDIIIAAGDTGGDTIHFVVTSAKSGVQKGITAFVQPVSQEKRFFIVTQLWPVTSSPSDQ